MCFKRFIVFWLSIVLSFSSSVSAVSAEEIPSETSIPAETQEINEAADDYETAETVVQTDEESTVESEQNDNPDDEKPAPDIATGNESADDLHVVEETEITVTSETDDENTDDTEIMQEPSAEVIQMQEQKESPKTTSAVDEPTEHPAAEEIQSQEHEANSSIMPASIESNLLTSAASVSVNATVTFSSGVSYKGKTPYVIYNGNEYRPAVNVTNKESGEVIDPAYYDVTYVNNINPGTGRVNVTLKGKYSGKASATFKIYLPATASTAIENTDEGIHLTWAPVEGAKGYVIYRRAWNLVSAGWTTFERWNNTTDTEWTDTKVYAGTRYQYGVKAYFNDPMDNYNLGEVGPLKTTVCITVRVLNSVTPGPKQMTVKWTPSKVFTGYQIKYATDSAFTKNVKAVKITESSKASEVIKNLVSGQTYYVTVRSYQVFEGMTYFGGWSNVKSAAIMLQTPVLTAISNTGNTVRLDWKAVDGAALYLVMRKADSGSWQSIGTTKETYYLDSSVSGNHTYSYTVRCVSADGKSYESAYDANGKTVKYVGLVYWAANGKAGSYHLSLNCTALKRSKNIGSGTLEDARRNGKTDPCNLCASGN
ncbi:MAG: hypothetical protein IJ120_07675 [Solobacterium sp.]|nr:hypothetical protein [Solobacterium sp.]